MPQVPRITEQQVEPGRVPDISVPSSAPIDTFGGGERIDRQTEIARGTLVDTFKESEKRRAELEAARLKAKQEMDTNLTIDADLQAAQLQNEIDLKAKSMKGRDAAGALEFADDEWKKGIKNIESTLFNQEQKNAFSVAAEKRALTLRKGIGSHMDSQFEQYSETLFKSGMKIAQEQASLNYTDLENVNDQFERQEALIRIAADQRGLGPEWIKNESMKSKSRTHAEIVMRMIFDGQIELASNYAEGAKHEILTDDLASIRRLQTEEKRVREAKSDEIQRQLYIKASKDELTHEQNDDALSQGQITPAFHGKLKAMINSVYDDDSIGDEDKTAKLFEAYERFEKLDGSKVDDRGKVVKRAKGNDLASLQEYRDWLGENKKYFRRSVFEDLMEVTQQDYNDAKEGKLGLWASLKQKLQYIGMDKESMGIVMAKSFGLMFSPNATVADAQKIADKTVESAVIKKNPNRTQYKIGQTITLPSGNWVVTGFDVDGEPIVDEVGK